MSEGEHGSMSLIDNAELFVISKTNEETVCVLFSIELTGGEGRASARRGDEKWVRK